jgi:hypothetical protein
MSRGHLASDRVQVKVMPRPEQDQERYDGHDRQQTVVSAEDAPGGTGVVPMDKVEKPLITTLCSPTFSRRTVSSFVNWSKKTMVSARLATRQLASDFIEGLVGGKAPLLAFRSCASSMRRVFSSSEVKTQMKF